MTCQSDEYLIRIYSEDEDGIITDRVDLSDGRSYCVGPGSVFAPPPPQKVVAGGNSAYRHGHDVVRVRYDNSTVDIRSLLIMGNRPEILAQRIRRITTLLEKARYRQERGWGERVYVERDWRHSTFATWDVDPAPSEYFTGQATVLRKEILRGEFIPPRESVTEIIAKGLEGNCRLNLECYPFWQGLQQNIIFEYDVANHTCNDYPPATRNFINVAAANLPGDAPCLLRIRMMNETAGVTIRNLRMGIKRQCHPVASPCCDDLTFQAEDGTFGTVSDDSALIGPDNDFSCTFGVRATPTDVTNKIQLSWSTASMGVVLPQGTYRAYGRIRNNDSARTVQAQLRLSGGGQVWLTEDQVTVETHAAAKFVMVDLGLVEIPPLNIAQFDQPASFLFALFLQTDAASGTIDIDYMLLLPVEGGAKLTEIPLWAFAPLTDIITLMVTDVSVEYNGFVDPPVTSIFVPATDTWAAFVAEDLGFTAYIEPGQDHCFVFSADQWDGAEGKALNDLDTQLEVTIDIIPQYLYIR